MNDAIRVHKLKKHTYIVRTRKIPDHVDNPQEYAKDAATANDPDFSESSQIIGINVEQVELCSRCREPTERKVPLESGHDAPLCQGCDEQLEGEEA